MRRTIIGLLLCLVASSVNAASVTTAGAGKPAVAAGYIGPLDIIGTNVIACYSTMACSAALRGNAALNACNSTGGVDVACSDLLTDAVTGALVPATIGGITCPGTNCTVKIWYDQTNGNQCNGNDCNLKNVGGVVANRPPLLASVYGAGPGLVLNGATNVSVSLSTNTTNVTQAQPYSLSSVGCQVANIGGLDLFFGNGSAATGSLYWDATPSFAMFAGSGGVVAASTRNTWQQYAGAFNNGGGSGSSGMVSGGSLITSVGAGTGGFSSNEIAVGFPGFPANFKTVENVIFAGDKSANFSALQANQLSRFGIGSC